MILVFVYMVVVFANGLAVCSGWVRVCVLFGCGEFGAFYGRFRVLITLFVVWVCGLLWICGLGWVGWLISRWGCAGLVAVLCRFFWYGCW